MLNLPKDYLFSKIKEIEFKDKTSISFDDDYSIESINENNLILEYIDGAYIFHKIYDLNNILSITVVRSYEP